jgi:ATP-dependent Clp protease protease subunit
MNTNEIKNAAPSFGGLIAEFSREQKLLESRSLFISEGVNSDTARRVVTDLLVLDSVGQGPIKIYLNSPGGEVNSGFAIFDTIRFIKSPVYIISAGLCASIATVINVAVKKERRFSMPNSRFLIHQPLIMGQIYGQASDLEIQAAQILKTREKINQLLAEECGQPLERVEKDTLRDYWMTPEEAAKYGLIGKVVKSTQDLGI